MNPFQCDVADRSCTMKMGHAGQHWTGSHIILSATSENCEEWLIYLLYNLTELIRLSNLALFKELDRGSGIRVSRKVATESRWGGTRQDYRVGEMSEQA